MVLKSCTRRIDQAPVLQRDSIEEGDWIIGRIEGLNLPVYIEKYIFFSICLLGWMIIYLNINIKAKPNSTRGCTLHVFLNQGQNETYLLELHCVPTLLEVLKYNTQCCLWGHFIGKGQSLETK